MKKIIDWVGTCIMISMLFAIFAPLLIILALLVLISNIPKIENTFVFDIMARVVIWVDKFVRGFELPWTSKKYLHFVLAYLTSVALWTIILWVIFG